MLKKYILQKPRSPDDFKDSIKLYIVGIPIDYSYENQTRIIEFKNILERAKSDVWPVYISSPPAYFRYLTPDGWKTIEETGVPITYIYTSIEKIRFIKYYLLTNKLFEIAISSNVPIVLLRPGSPRVGDSLVKFLIKKFQNRQDKVEMLDVKSGVDIVGDLAEKAIGKYNLSRQYISAQNLFYRREISKIQGGDMLLIHCLSSNYIYRNKPFFGKVVTRLFQLGLGDKLAYIKSPKTEGILMTVKKLSKRLYQFNQNDHYTLVIIQK